LIHSANSTWMLGYPEQAVKDELLKRTEEANRLGREDSLPFVTECLVPVYSGIALIRKGQTSEGVALLERGLAAWERGGGRASSRYYKSVLAEGMAQPGDVAGALHLVDEAIVPIERPGWEERHYYAEALRIKGWLLSLKGDAAGAERAYTASLDRARQQQAKSWELRTATSYARLMRNRGRGGVRTARAGVRLVHGRLRDKGPEGRQGAARSTRNIGRIGAGGTRLSDVLKEHGSVLRDAPSPRFRGEG
jgi:hypothetical protein